MYDAGLKVARGKSEVSFNLRFPGQYYQAETGLNYNYERDYDSSVGRYIESDPLGLRGGGFSTYGYVSGNPVSNIDPFGLAPPDRTGSVPSPAPSVWGFPNQQWNQSRDAEAIALQDTASNAIDAIIEASKAAKKAIQGCFNKLFEEDKNCEALYQATLQTCASLKGRKRFACFEAARENREQCYQETGKTAPSL